MHSNLSDTDKNKTPESLKKLAALKLILPHEESFFIFLDKKNDLTDKEKFNFHETKQKHLTNLDPKFTTLPNDVIDLILEIIEERYYYSRHFYLAGQKLFGENFTNFFPHKDCDFQKNDTDKLTTFLNENSRYSDVENAAEQDRQTSEDQTHLKTNKFYIDFCVYVLGLSFNKNLPLLTEAVVKFQDSPFFLHTAVITDFLIKHKDAENVLDFMNAYYSKLSSRHQYISSESFLYVPEFANPNHKSQFNIQIMDWIYGKIPVNKTKSFFRSIEKSGRPDLAACFQTKYAELLSIPKSPTLHSSQASSNPGATKTTLQTISPFFEISANSSKRKNNGNDNDDKNKKKRDGSPDPG